MKTATYSAAVNRELTARTQNEKRIDFTRINSDMYGNPRYVCSWLSFNTNTYEEALKIARPLGGRKFNTKTYGGGIVFQSYNTQALAEKILAAL